MVPKPEHTGEVYHIILLDGIGISSLVCLIARTPQAVTDWHWAGWESSNTWEKLLERQPAPVVVVCDGQKGILLAIARCWPKARIQRCIFHIWQNIRVKLTLHPQTEAGRARSILPSKPLTGKNDWKPGINATKALFGNEPTSRIPNRTNDAGGTPMAG